MTQRRRRGGDADLVADLTWLRKGSGLTMDRLARAGAVVHACGGVDQPIEAIHGRLLSALRAMSDTRGGQALWAAYGIESSGSSLLKDRRASYATAVARSPDTVLDWEDEAVDELALRLLSGYYGGAPTPHQLPIPHGRFLLSNLHVVCVNKDRIFVESHQSRTIIPLIDLAQQFRYASSWPTELDDVRGGALARTEFLSGGTLHYIDFEPPLQRGRAHTFSFRERVPDAEPEPFTNEDFSGQSFETPALKYTVEVHFLTSRPAVLWAYNKLSRYERPGQLGSGTPVTLDTDGQASASFFDLHGGLCSGIAWRWTA